MGRSTSEESTAVNTASRGQVPEIMEAIQVEIGNLEEGMRIVLKAEPETEAKMPAVDRSDMVTKLESIFRRLKQLNTRLDL